jgi:RNA methyltransferase, RsmE family
MEIRRFYIDENNLSNGVAKVVGDEFVHAVKVLRQKVGYTVILCTGDGFDLTAEITEINKDNFNAKVISRAENTAVPKRKITLYQGSLKGGKNDFVVQKAVELGVSKVVFFVSRYVTETAVSVDRLQKIAIEAMKQCGRADKLSVEVLAFSDALKTASGEKLFFYEFERETRVNDIEISGDASVFIGSEGGFSDYEVQLAKESGAHVLSLGNRILRAETATVAALTLVMNAVGEL